MLYQVSITQQLSDTVVSGQFAPQLTVVTRCALSARRRTFEGMEVPQFRLTTLHYLMRSVLWPRIAT
jgi:hypothetical protein